MSRNSFVAPLIVEVMADGKTFRVTQRFIYFWGRGGFEIHVRTGFISDFASIPKFARIIVPKLGKYTKAAVIHDALYRNAMFTGTRFTFTRAKADLCFLDGMKDLGVTKWKRTLMYWTVRLFGWIAWQKR